MTQRATEYRRLRAEYDAAYAKLCLAQNYVREQRPGQKSSDRALDDYRQTRDRLAHFLLLRVSEQQDSHDIAAAG